VKDRVLEFLAVRQLRAQEMAKEVETTGEVPVSKLKATNHRPNDRRGIGIAAYHKVPRVRNLL